MEPYRVLDEATGAELASYDPGEKGDLSARMRAAMDAKRRVRAIAKAEDRVSAIIVTGPAPFVRRRYNRQSWRRSVDRQYREACANEACPGWSATIGRGPCAECKRGVGASHVETEGPTAG